MVLLCCDSARAGSAGGDCVVAADRAQADGARTVGQLGDSAAAALAAAAARALSRTFPSCFLDPAAAALRLAVAAAFAGGLGSPLPPPSPPELPVGLRVRWAASPPPSALVLRCTRERREGGGVRAASHRARRGSRCRCRASLGPKRLCRCLREPLPWRLSPLTWRSRELLPAGALWEASGDLRYWR